MGQNTAQTIEQVKIALDKAKVYGLEIEVATYAMLILQADSEVSVEEALAAAMRDWDIA